MSVTMLAAALVGPKLVTHIAAKTIVRIGLGAIVIAAAVMAGTIDVTLNEPAFKLSLALFGVGAGLMMSQLGNVIMSSAPPGKTNEAGGLQGTAQNLGASLGTALIGSVLLTGLLTGFNSRILDNPAYADSTKTAITGATQQGIEIVTTEQVHAAALDAGLSASEADALTADYADAELEALRKAMFAVSMLALLSLVFTRRLPDKPLPGERAQGITLGLIQKPRVSSPYGRDRRRRAREDVRKDDASARRDDVFRPRRTGLRPARPERRRQVDGGADPRHAQHRRRRLGFGRRP